MIADLKEISDLLLFFPYILYILALYLKEAYALIYSPTFGAAKVVSKKNTRKGLLTEWLWEQSASFSAMPDQAQVTSLSC